MSARREYRATDRERVFEALGYAVASLSGLAAGESYPPQAVTPESRAWAQRVLDRMVAEGYIEPRDEVQS
jgi:hypothetical protein